MQHLDNHTMMFIIINQPVEILLNIIKPTLLTSTAAPKSPECLTVFRVLHLQMVTINIMIMIMMLLHGTFDSFLNSPSNDDEKDDHDDNDDDY